MKTSIRIAKLELSTLFYSPVAWLVLIIFTIQSGLTFTGRLTLFDGFLHNGEQVSHLTGSIFGGYAGLWPDVEQHVYLYIPLLTMGLISREINSGSIKLLLSSPVTIGSIVLGKFLAMMVYCLVLASILVLFVVTGAYSIQSLDTGLVLSGLIGIYLLICAYSAIGLFMSSLTSYQVVAAISTLVLFAALQYIGDMGQEIPFVRDLTYFLSISGRSLKFTYGLITSKDVLYFIIVIVLFLGLTFLKLASGRESRHAGIKAVRYVFFVFIMLMAGYLSSRPKLIAYCDMTAVKSRTLTKNSQAVVKQLIKPLKITTYVNLFADYARNFFPAKRNENLSRMEQYERFMPGPGLEMKYVYYYDSTESFLFNLEKELPMAEKAKKSAESFGLDFKSFLGPEAIGKIIDLKPEENSIVSLWEYDGKKGITRMYKDPGVVPGEQEILAVLKGFVTPPPRIAVLTGNNERSVGRTGDKDYKMMATEPSFRHALINQGFNVLTVSLSDQTIPKGLAGLVIADPKTPFTPGELAKIREYISEGGNLLIAGEPGGQAILNPLLGELGVRLTERTIIQESEDYAPDFILAGMSGEPAGYGESFRKLFKDSIRISMPGAAELQYVKSSPFRTAPIVVTNEKNTWATNRKVNLDSAKIAYIPGQGDEKKQTTLALALTRKIAGKEQKILVFGDADFMSNRELGRNNPRTGNFSLTVELFKWFSNGEFPVDTSRPATMDNTLHIARGGILLIKSIFVFLVPLLLALSGGLLLIQRSRK